MRRFYRDSDGSFKESASEAFLQHSTGKWDRSKTKYVKIVKSPSGRDAYLYPDDLEPGKKYGPKVGEAKAEEKESPEDDRFKNSETGQYGEGNIDLFDRPVYRNDDGSISTVDSFSTNIDGVEVLLPTIGRDSNGKAIRLTEDEAIEKYMKDGKHLGKFKTPEEATAYAEKLHKDQEKLYPNGGDEQPKAKTGKYAVVSGGQHYKFDNYDDVMKLIRGDRSASSSSSKSSGSSEGSSKYNGITAADVESAKEQIKAGKLDEKGNAKSASSSTSKSKSKSKSSKTASSSTTKSETKSSKSEKSETSRDERWKERESQEGRSNISTGKNTPAVSITRSSASATTAPRSREKKVTGTGSVEKGEALGLHKEVGIGDVNIQRSAPTSTPPRSREKRVTGTGTVAKGKALGTYKEVGNGAITELLKKKK